MALLKELENGKHKYFRLVGKVKITEKSFTGPRTYEPSTWFGVNESFGIDTGNENIVWVKVGGGYDLKKNTLSKRDLDYKLLEIPVADRHNEAWISRVNESQFKRASILKDDEGKNIQEKFISDIDYAEYLQENLVEGMEVVVSGEVSYSWGKDGETVYRNFDVKNIYLNPVVENEKGEKVLKNAHDAFVRQTYLVHDGSLDSRYKKDLEKDGEIVISLFVPQYISNIKRNGQKVVMKRIMPVQQALIYRIDPNDKDNLERAMKWPERLFKVGRDKIREIHLISKINEGHSTQTGVSQISASLQELIDEGLISLEDVKSQTTVRGARTSELVYIKPHVEVSAEGIAIPYLDDKYDATVLVAPMFDDSEGEDDSSDEEDNEEKIDSIGEDEFASLFGI